MRIDCNRDVGAAALIKVDFLYSVLLIDFLGKNFIANTLIF